MTSEDTSQSRSCVPQSLYHRVLSGPQTATQLAALLADIKVPHKTSTAHYGSFTMLPTEVVHAILAQLIDDNGPPLATDTRALYDISRSCTAFARLFREPALWHVLIVRRWGLAASARLQSKQANLQELRRAFASRPIKHPTSSCIREYVGDVSSPAPHGTYQLRLHKQQLDSSYESKLTLNVKSRQAGSSSNDQNPTRYETIAAGSYYNFMYDHEFIITTEPFHIASQSSHCHVDICDPPCGLHSIQLCRIWKGDLIRESPMFQSAMQRRLDSSKAGYDEFGKPLFISMRQSSEAAHYTELGRSSNIDLFLYGQYGNCKEQSAEHKTFHEKEAWPGVLVNVSAYEWITTSMQRVHTLRPRAVLFADTAEGSLHAVRIEFRGWQRVSAPGVEEIVAMQCTGPTISVLPGKFVFGNSVPDYAMFTWKGKATGGPAVTLGVDAEFQMLCYRVFQG